MTKTELRKVWVFRDGTWSRTAMEDLKKGEWTLYRDPDHLSIFLTTSDGRLDENGIGIVDQTIDVELPIGFLREVLDD